MSGQAAVNGWHFVRDHNPVWAARVFGGGVKRATLAVPRPNWNRGRPTLTRHASAVSVHVRNAWKHRPLMPRPHYRLRGRPVQSVHMNYVDVALFYIIAVTLPLSPSSQLPHPKRPVLFPRSCISAVRKSECDSLTSIDVFIWSVLYASHALNTNHPHML